MSIRLRLFHTYTLENDIYSIFIFRFLCSRFLFLRIFAHSYLILGTTVNFNFILTIPLILGNIGWPWEKSVATLASAYLIYDFTQILRNVTTNIQWNIFKCIQLDLKLYSGTMACKNEVLLNIFIKQNSNYFWHSYFDIKYIGTWIFITMTGSIYT